MLHRAALSSAAALRRPPTAARLLSTTTTSTGGSGGGGGGGCPITGGASSEGGAPTGGAPTRLKVSSEGGGAPTTLKIVPTLPYLGSFVPQYSNVPAFDPTKFYDYYPELRRRHGDFYRMGFPGTGKGRDGIMYVATDPNEMQKVIRQESRKAPYPRGIVETEWPLLHWIQSNNSVLAVGTNDTDDKMGFAGRGKTWKRLRTFLQTDLLSPQAAAGYVPIMVEAAKLASKGAPASADDLNAYTNRCSFDMFYSLMYGDLAQVADPTNTGRDEENVKFCSSAMKGMDTMMKQMISPLHIFAFKSMGITATPLYNEMSSALDTCMGIARSKYMAFRERSEKGELTDSEKSSYLGRAILRQAEEDSNVSEEDLAELVNISLFAAIDTTSSLLSWNILNLALNPEVQEKLHAELAHAVETCGGINAQTLRKGNIPYLHAILRESHRLTPAAPMTVFKETLADVDLHGYTVLKDSVVVMDAYSLGIDEDFVEDPEEFRPERWLADAVETRKGTKSEVLDHPFYRDPFSQGSRKCPGSRVANNEVLILLSQLVLDWKMSPPEGYGKENVTYAMSGMIHCDMPKLQFEAR